MELHQLPKIKTKNKKRIGRGYGSGKGGHTVGRGSKGEKARGKIALTFEGTKIKKSLIKRLPLLRGKGKLKPLKNKPLAVNLKYLNFLPHQTVVNLEVLVKAGIVKEKEAKNFGIKILGDGDLKVPLKIALPCSKSNKKKIKKAGGEVLKKEKEDKRVNEDKEEKKRQRKRE